jgi:hypothetical protein
MRGFRALRECLGDRGEARTGIKVGLSAEHGIGRSIPGHGHRLIGSSSVSTVAIVVILEHKGDPERLMAAGKELARLHPDGVLAQAIAPTEDGMMLVRIWESEHARAAWAENPEHHAALKASGIIDASRNRTSRAYETDQISVVGAGVTVQPDRADTR